jgi:ribosome biogenesis GTPase
MGLCRRLCWISCLNLRDEVVAADKLAARLAQKSDEKVQGKALHKWLDENYKRH